MDNRIDEPDYQECRRELQQVVYEWMGRVGYDKRVREYFERACRLNAPGQV